MILSKSRTICASVLAVAVLSTAAFPANAQSRLRWKFKEGETLNYSMTQNMTTSMNFMGNNLETKMNQIMEFTWTVGKIESDGSARITQTITRIKFKMTMPPPLNQTIEYDSQDGKAPAGPFGNLIGGMFKAMVGADFTMKIDPLGHITDTKVPPELVKEFKKNPALANMGEMFSEEGLKKFTSQNMLSFPEKTLTKGDTWENKAETKMPFGTMKMATKYTYAGQDKNGLERIRSEITMGIEPAENAQIQIEFKEGASSGEILFDNKAGRLRETKIEQTMKMEITVGKMVIEQVIDSLTTMKLVTGKTSSRSQ